MVNVVVHRYIFEYFAMIFSYRFKTMTLAPLHLHTAVTYRCKHKTVLCGVTIILCYVQIDSNKLLLITILYNTIII